MSVNVNFKPHTEIDIWTLDWANGGAYLEGGLSLNEIDYCKLDEYELCCDSNYRVKSLKQEG